MGCNCKKGKTAEKYVATFKDGTTATYSSETEAKFAVARRGGSYKKA